MDPCVSADDFYAVSPKGDVVKICPELFNALKEFASSKLNGVISVEMKTGGIAGVSGNRRYK